MEFSNLRIFLAVLDTASVTRAADVAGLTPGAVSQQLRRLSKHLGAELFVRSGVWVNVVWPLLAVVLSYTALSAYHYVAEQRERKKIHGAFGRYVAPAVIDVVVEDHYGARFKKSRNQTSIQHCTGTDAG
jgi:hypothetical protein